MNPKPNTSGLRPAKPGEARNKEGRNGQSEAHDELVKFLLAPDVDQPDKQRAFRMFSASYETSLIVGKEGASDRKLLTEQLVGKARESHDITNSDGSLTAGLASVLGMNSEQRAAVLAELDRKIAATREPKPDGDAGT